MCQEEYAERKKQRVKYHMGLVTRVGAEKSLETVPEKVFRTHYQVPPTEPETLLTRKVVLKHDSCFVAGLKRFNSIINWVFNSFYFKVVIINSLENYRRLPGS